MPSRAAALAVTGQGDGTWLVDAAGEPVAPAWLWLDARAAAIVEELRRGRRARAASISTPAAASTPATRVASSSGWSGTRRRSWTAPPPRCHCKDWLYLNLTGQRATDVSEGIFTFGDFRTRRYVPEILECWASPSAGRLLPTWWTARARRTG